MCVYTAVNMFIFTLIYMIHVVCIHVNWNTRDVWAGRAEAKVLLLYIYR